MAWLQDYSKTTKGIAEQTKMFCSEQVPMNSDLKPIICFHVLFKDSLLSLMEGHRPEESN